ncbi:MAG: hypothetical protein M1817_001698 [Caeruleum heppii]|nr:MAG: hypothetical protein M1817_001698 [Caeruleum heppii]
MPMKLNGSCHCGSVVYELESHTPVPYQLCSCSICRKVGGYNGSVNLGAQSKTLKISKGEDVIKKYHAIVDGKQMSSERAFCGNCATMLWVFDASWPDLIHPFASSVDSNLPLPDEMVCVKANSKPDWVRLPEGKKSVHQDYGEDSIEGWHKKHGFYVD